MPSFVRNRIAYALLAICVVVIGMASRRYRDDLPSFIGEYSGDTLWALMLYLIVSAAIPSQSISLRTVVSITSAAIVETSQLYHAPWIDGIRNTRLGGLVLGFGFLWSDLVCYSFGVAIGAVVEFIMHSSSVRLPATKDR